MNLKVVVCIILFIIFLLGVFYILSREKKATRPKIQKKRKPRTKIQEAYESTVGYEYDDAAKAVIAARAETAEDHIRKARVLTHNVLTRNDVDADAVRLDINAEYAAAVDAALNNPGIHTDGDAEIPMHVILHEAAQIIGLEDNFVDDAVLAANQLRRKRILRTAREVAGDQPRLIAAIARDEHFGGVTIPRDPQNVHDRELTNEMHAKYSNLVNHNVAEYGDKATMLSVGKNADELNIPSITNAGRLMGVNAQRVLEDMLNSGNTIGINGETVDTGTFVDQVWKRIHSKQNIERKEDLVNAFANGLASGVENGNLVCTTGKCMRILDSLTLLDTDPSIAKAPKTAALLRAEIFNTTQRMLENQIETLSPKLQDYHHGRTEEALIDADKKTYNKALDIVKQGMIESSRKDYGVADTKVVKEALDAAFTGLDYA